MAKVNERFYGCVPANTSISQAYTPANNTFLSIDEVGGSAGIIIDTSVQIWWDKGGAEEDLIFSSHGDSIQHEIGVKKTGDGIKKVEIILTNDLGQQDCIGGYFKGEEDAV